MTDMRTGADRPTCVVRWKTAPHTRDEGATALLSWVRAKGQHWMPAVCGYLGVAEPAPVLIWLDTGTRLPMTRDHEIRLPARRGPDGWTTDIDTLPHELVHALAGRSPCDVLNEGLAVHVDARLRLAGPVWPFYHLPLRRWLRALVDEGCYVPLADLLAGVPMPVTLRYLHAGAYVTYLIDGVGLDAYLQRHRAGQALATGESIQVVERAWLDSLGGPITKAERRQQERSLRLLARDHQQHDAAPTPTASGAVARKGGPN